MMLASFALATGALASETPVATDPTLDSEAMRPVDVYVNGVSQFGAVLIDTLTIDDSLGEQTTCAFTLVNPLNAPSEGASVRVTYYSERLFEGTIKRVSRAVNNLDTFWTYACECADWSELLARVRIRRNFTNLPPHNIIQSLLDNELAGNGLTLGTIDQPYEIALADSNGGSALDLLQAVAQTIGHVLRVDADKRISLYSTSQPAAPAALTTATVLSVALAVDRDDYRNVQMVQVTGTPPEESAADPIVFTLTRQSDEQIAERAALEGTNGRYEAYDEITHPTSNVTAELSLLADSYCTAKLAVAGTVRRTLTATLYGYGWHSGQAATATFSQHGVSGTWYVQRVSVRTEGARLLKYTVELTESSFLQRAYAAWLRIVETGKIVVQLPGGTVPSTQTVTVTTLGASNWTVPANIVNPISVSCYGPGGGGGSGWREWRAFGPLPTCTYQSKIAGRGGNGGFAKASVNVVSGNDLNLFIATGGAGATSGDETSDGVCGADNTGTNGSASANDTTVTYLGVEVARGKKGGGGVRAKLGGTAGAPGGGSGGIVVVGGGMTGGDGGTGYPGPGSAGQSGKILIKYTVSA